MWLVVWLLAPRGSAYQHRHRSLWALFHVPPKSRRQGRAVTFGKRLDTGDGWRHIPRVLGESVPEEQQPTGREICFLFQVRLIRRVEGLGRVAEEERLVPREGSSAESVGRFRLRELTQRMVQGDF